MGSSSVASIAVAGAAAVLLAASPAFAFGHGGGGHGGGGFHGGGFGGGHAGGFGGGGLGRAGGFSHGGASFGTANAGSAGGGLQTGRSVGYAPNATGAGAAIARGGRGGISGRQANASYRYGRHRGFGGGVGYGAFGFDNGFYDGDYADYGYGYGYPDDGEDYAYGADQPYGGYDGPVQTGRSAARIGDTCTTPVKACTLYHQSYVGGGCSCKVSGGRAEGRVTP